MACTGGGMAQSGQDPSPSTTCDVISGSPWTPHGILQIFSFFHFTVTLTL